MCYGPSLGVLAGVIVLCVTQKQDGFKSERKRNKSTTTTTTTTTTTSRRKTKRFVICLARKIINRATKFQVRQTPEVF